jgi:cutinase
MTGVTLLRMSASRAAIATVVVSAAAVLISGPAPSAAAQVGPAPGPGPGPAPGPAAASSSGCPDIEVIFARGTDDTPGLGTPGQAFVNSLRPLVGGRTLTTYAVNYPASYDFLAAADGAADATNRISTMAQQCPTTQIVLGGYSQGAAVVDMLAGVPPLGNKIGDIGSGPPLPSNLLPNIAAVVAFGNPATKFSNPLTSSVFGGRAIDLCKDGDPICSRGRNPFAHNDYVSAGMTQQAANFVAGLV